jgi:uncharacterized protein (TIGR03437 family)
LRHVLQDNRTVTEFRKDASKAVCIVWQHHPTELEKYLIHDLMKYGLKSNGKWALALFVPMLLTGLARAQITPSYTISAFAGNYTSGFAGDGSTAASAQLASPFAVAVDKSGNVFIADQFNNRIRKVDRSGTISTVAGDGTSGYKGDASAATSAQLSNPEGVAVDSSGNLYIADTSNSVVRKVSTSGTISTIAGNFTTGAGFSGDGAAATAALLFHPSGIVVDAKGNVYIADTSNNIVRIVTTDGKIATYAGNFGAGIGFTGDGGPATSARLNNPEGLALDSAGNLYIADGNNNRIRVVNAASGVISTVAGSSLLGSFAGDGGLATKARLNTPKGIAVDSVGNLFIADTYNARIRMVSPAGIISTIAGNGATGSGGDGQVATTASLYFPSGVAVDSLSQNVYIVDNQNNVIRLLTAAPALPTIFSNGVVSASAFGTLPGIAPGSWIEIYGTNLALDARGLSASDLNGVNVPTSLAGTKVTIAGQPAYFAYISAGQVNVQVPSNVTAGTQSLVVTTPYGSTSAYNVTVNATQPGLLAPASFIVGGKQYLAALFSDGTTFVAPPGAIAGVTSRPAKRGEIITIYGVGFGMVTPNIPAGQLVQQSNTVASPVTFSFAGTAAMSNYSGLAPQQVGLYQFNVVVPNVADSDLVPLTFTFGGATVTTQTLYTAIRN